MVVELHCDTHTDYTPPWSTGERTLGWGNPMVTSWWLHGDSAEYSIGGINSINSRRIGIRGGLFKERLYIPHGKYIIWETHRGYNIYIIIYIYFGDSWYGDIASCINQLYQQVFLGIEQWDDTLIKSPEKLYKCLHHHERKTNSNGY